MCLLLTIREINKRKSEGIFCLNSSLSPESKDQAVLPMRDFLSGWKDCQLQRHSRDGYYDVISIRTRAKGEACFKEYAVITYVFIRSSLKPAGVWVSTTAARRWSLTRVGDVHHVILFQTQTTILADFTCVMRTLRLVTTPKICAYTFGVWDYTRFLDTAPGNFRPHY